METVITPTTDLTPFLGKRVRITRQDPNFPDQPRSVFYGVFESLRHWDGAPFGYPGRQYCGGMLWEESHGDCRGGLTGFDLPLYDATIELAEISQQQLDLENRDDAVARSAHAAADDDIDGM